MANSHSSVSSSNDMFFADIARQHKRASCDDSPTRRTRTKGVNKLELDPDEYFKDLDLDSNTKIPAVRVSNLYKAIEPCIWLASQRPELYEMFVQVSKKMFETLCLLEYDLVFKTPAACSRVEGLHHNPHIPQTKSRKKTNKKEVEPDFEAEVQTYGSSGEIKSALGKATDRKKKPRVCKACNEVGVGHDCRNCPGKNMDS